MSSDDFRSIELPVVTALEKIVLALISSLVSALAVGGGLCMAGFEPANRHPGPDVGFNRAKTLFRLGRVEPAVAGYREVLRKDPGDVDARFNLAKAYRRIAEPELLPAGERSLLVLGGNDEQAREGVERLTTRPGRASALAGLRPGLLPSSVSGTGPGRNVSAVSIEGRSP